MPLQPGDTLDNGKYRIVRLVGRGGFGFVYVAQDTVLQEPVALKELIPALAQDEEMLRRFLVEAKATMRLRLKRIVATHGIFAERGNYYIAMEYMPGGSLEDRLRDGGRLPVEEARRTAADICEALECAHEDGVVHCDLKPVNILFGADGRAKVADFGIAHVPNQMFTRSWQTAAGFAAGTLPYMSPEQAEGVRDDPRTDVYALGAILFRMLTGRTYIDFDPRDTPMAQARNAQRIQAEAPAQPSTWNREVAPWLDQVVLTALAKRPEDRFQSAGDLRAALLQTAAAPRVRPAGRVATQTLATEILPTRGGASAIPSRRTHGRWIAAGAAILLVAAVGALFFSSDRTRRAAVPDPATPAALAQVLTRAPTPDLASPSQTPEKADTPAVPTVDRTSGAAALKTATDRPAATAQTRAVALLPIAATETAKPNRPTETPRSTSEPTAAKTPTATPTVTENHFQATATRRPAPQPSPVRPTPTSAARPPGSAAATTAPTEGRWTWRGSGPFEASNGVFAVVNYTDRLLKVTVRGRGEFVVPAENGAIGYMQLSSVNRENSPPIGEYTPYYEVPGLTPYGTGSIVVQARRVTLVSVAISAVGVKPVAQWYEGADEP